MGGHRHRSGDEVNLGKVGTDEINRSVANPALELHGRMDRSGAAVSGIADANMNIGFEFGNVAAAQALALPRQAHS